MKAGASGFHLIEFNFCRFIRTFTIGHDKRNTFRQLGLLRYARCVNCLGLRCVRCVAWKPRFSETQMTRFQDFPANTQ